VLDPRQEVDIQEVMVLDPTQEVMDMTILVIHRTIPMSMKL